jgi:hypothetical protein
MMRQTAFASMGATIRSWQTTAEPATFTVQKSYGFAPATERTMEHRAARPPTLFHNAIVTDYLHNFLGCNLSDICIETDGSDDHRTTIFNIMNNQHKDPKFGLNFLRSQLQRVTDHYIRKACLSHTEVYGRLIAKDIAICRLVDGRVFVDLDKLRELCHKSYKDKEARNEKLKTPVGPVQIQKSIDIA